MKEVEPKEVKDLLTRESCIVIDIRPKERFERERLEGAISKPFDTVDKEELKQFVRNSTKKIIIMCERGISSAGVINYLQQEEDLELHNLKGGLEACKKENLKVFTEKKTSLLSYFKKLFS